MLSFKKIFYLLCFLLCCVKNHTNDSVSKKAIVIGASSGMGREVAKLLSKEGYIVGIAARRISLLESLQAELSNRSYIKELDVTAADAREKLQELIDEMGGLDLIVISISPAYELKSWTWEDKRKILDVCALSFIAMADVALEYFKKQKFGHLVGISSIFGLRGGSGCPEYAGAKACIMYYMEGVRNYMIQKGINIQVTDIVPGYVAVEYSPFGTDPNAYCEITCEQAGKEIVKAIKMNKKVAIIPSSIWVLAFLRKYMPDWLYNKYFSWL